MPNVLRSIGYTQERVHSGLLAFLAELHESGLAQPLTAFLKAIGIALPNAAHVKAMFELRRSDLVLEVVDGATRDLIVVEFKVDSIEGGFWSPPSSHQTNILHEAFPTAASCLYITLGDGEFAGPPACGNFLWIGLDQFRDAVTDAVTAIAVPLPILCDWQMILMEEQKRRRDAPNLAAQGKVAQNSSAGYRAVGVPMAVYGAIISAWNQQGFQQTFGCMRAYPVGQGPDAILNLWDHGQQCTGHYYFEVTGNGMLRLKTTRNSLNQVSWAKITATVAAVSPPPHPVTVMPQPPAIGETVTLATWQIGLWGNANSPDAIAKAIAQVLDAYDPGLAALWP